MFIRDLDGQLSFSSLQTEEKYIEGINVQQKWKNKRVVSEFEKRRLEF